MCLCVCVCVSVCVSVCVVFDLCVVAMIIVCILLFLYGQLRLCDSISGMWGCMVFAVWGVLLLCAYRVYM